MKHVILAINLALLTLAICPAFAGQSLFPPTAQEDSSAVEGPAVIFRAIGDGMSAGDERLFSAYLDRMVSLNIRGRADGYYSANQARQILRFFFSSSRVISFAFSTLDTGAHPFATGGGVIATGSRSERVQVYVGLTLDRTGWVITQMNIY
jgi:hypothetical protein